MKAIKTIGVLITGCALACFTSEINAQTTSSTGSGVKLTPEQMAAREAAEKAQAAALFQQMINAFAQAQAAQPARPRLSAAQLAAQQNAAIVNQQTTFNLHFGPWLQPVTQGSNGVPQSLDDITAASKAAAMQEAQQLQAQYLQDQTNVDAFLARFPTNTFETRPVRIDENGHPVFIGLMDTYQATDTFAPAVWTNSNPALDLKGDGVTVHMWDGGNVRTTHVELNGRATNLENSPLADTNHATEVAGIIGAHGVNGTAIGLAPNATVLASDTAKDYSEVLTQIGSGHLLQSNHSYGNLTLGWVESVFYYNSQYGFNGRYPVWYGNTNVSLTEDPNFGNYQYDATNIDTIVYNHPTTVMCWAAGNERGPQGQPLYSPASLFFILTAQGNTPVSTVFGNWFTPPNVATVHNGYFTLDWNSAAKNSIVVGATTENTVGYTGTNSVANASYTSYGPARDGRIKPDLAGVGGDNSLQVFCTEATADNAYSYDSGTSMATPNVTGAIGLMRQCWNQYNPTNYPALASTIKAVLLHTASQVGPNRGPNFVTGWGLINVSNAVGVVRSNFSGFTLTNLPLTHVKEIVLQSGVTNSFPITVAAGTPLLKVTMVWTDPPGPFNPETSMIHTNSVLLASQKALVNDLDLRVIGNGQTNLPWVLDPVNYQRAATTGDDSVNNVEVVEVSNPPAGVYTVRVTNKGTLTGSTQAFSLVITGNVDTSVPPLSISENMVLTSPTNQLAVKWPSVPGGVYQVLYSTNLASGTWNMAANPITAGQTNVAVVLPINPSDTARFFRLGRLK